MGPSAGVGPPGTPGTPAAAVAAAASTAAPPVASRNILEVLLGDTLFATWYPSFYPEDLVGRDTTERLHVCRWCFKYTKDLLPYLTHLKVCKLREDGPPGRPIYARPPFSIYAVDGAAHPLFAQNLSLFAKLFLDNKSVFFDVAGFDYFLLMHDPTPGCCPAMHPVGFFSKEKMSWDNNNLACILVFPPWQRRGLGRVLMGASYELSRREGRIGGPEKPLSDMGRRGYMRFWTARVAAAVLTQPQPRGKAKSAAAGMMLSVAELAARCAMTVDDVVTALKEMGVCQLRPRAEGVVISKARVRQWAQATGADLTPPVDEDGFLDRWVPSRNGDEDENDEEEEEEGEDEGEEDEEEDGDDG